MACVLNGGKYLPTAGGLQAILSDESVGCCRRDARISIDGGYRLERVTPIDQFLYSPHVEAVAIFRR